MTSARDFGIQVVRSSGSEENVICPFHSDSSPSASYNKAKGLFFCYVCGFGLSNRQLAERLGLDPDAVESTSETLEDFDLLDTDAPLDLGVKCIANDYLSNRKIHPDIAHLYNVHYKDGTVPAMVLPVPNLKGEIEGAVWRYINPVYSRYVKMGRMTPVWPMMMLNVFRPGETVIVTEGAWSAMRIASRSYTPISAVIPVALLGAKANQGILDALAPFNPIFLYDDDEAGERACRKMRQLAPLVPSFTLSTSPDDMSDEQLDELGYKLLEVMNA